MTTKIKTRRRVYHIVKINAFGYIEDVLNSGTSFNVYRLNFGTIPGKFYKSAYELETAEKYLKELENDNN